MLLKQRLAVLPFSGAIGSKTFEAWYGIFRWLEREDKVRGVLMMVESPGGGATASELIYERLLAISNKKPLYAFCTFAASGGYLASLAAARIYAPRTAAIGSIGVISLKPVLKELFEKVGLDLEVIKKGRMKDMSLFHRGFTEEERESMDALNEAVYRRFVDLVSERRNLPREKALELATGAMYPAEKARELGLIDAVKGFDEALEDLCRATGVKKERAVFVRPKKPFLKRFLGTGLGGGLLDGLFEISR